MTPRGERRWHIGALALYSAAAMLFIDHGASITRNILGFYSDPYLYIWFLEWWPWSLAHHLDPFYTNLVWQPGGLNLAWTTTVPLLALAGLPVTMLSGPVLAYNLLILLSPVLSAMAAYFLCLRLTGWASASLIGGYVFGFSTYEMTETLDHLNLGFTVFIPLLVLVFLRRLDGDMSRRRAIILLTLFLAGQFLVSTELFATSIFFGAFAWVMAVIMLPQRRGMLYRTGIEVACATTAAAILVSPILFRMFNQPDHLDLPVEWPFRFSNDVLNLIIPTFSTLPGGMAAQALSMHFSSYIDEEGAYIGTPLVILVGLFARQYWAHAFARFLLLTAAGILVASFGPQLWFGGIFTRIVLPWYAFLWLPLISSAEPDRFILYIWLILAIIIALWLGGLCGRPGARFGYALAIAGCLFIMPVPHPVQPVPQSRFFEPGRVQQVLGYQEKLLILPYGFRGKSTYWQEENHYGFQQTGGYLGVAKAELMDDPAMRGLTTREPGPDFPADVAAICLATGTGYVIAGPGTAPAMLAMLEALPWQHRQLDDVVIFTVPPAPHG